MNDGRDAESTTKKEKILIADDDHCIVIKGASGNVTVQDDYAQFNQDYNKAKGLKIGANAKITYKTVDSINYATKVEQ